MPLVISNYYARLSPFLGFMAPIAMRDRTTRTWWALSRDLVSEELLLYSGYKDHGIGYNDTQGLISTKRLPLAAPRHLFEETFL